MCKLNKTNFFLAIIEINNLLQKKSFFMRNVSKELLREYIKEQNFTNANDILNGLKDMFRDVLQEAL